jgi:hypothetical protein
VSAPDAIAALVHAYAERIDAGDLEGVAELFAHGTFGASGGPARRGVDELLAVFRRAVILHDDGTPRTKHVVTNLTIAVDAAAGTATARSYFTVLQATATLPLQVIVAGRYEDRFACADGTWRFTERVVHMDLRGDLSQHLRSDG